MSHGRLKFGYENPGVGPTEAFENGILAEKHGFDFFWVGDHFVDLDGARLEPWTVLSAVAVRTSRIKLGSGVTDPQRTHPSRTAHSVASLDTISGGRAILGIGAGEAMNVVPFGLPWEKPATRVRRVEEAIQVIRQLWSSSKVRRVTFGGDFYSLKEAFLAQSPTQRPCPPIYLGAISGRRMLEVVGRYADGWYSWLNTPETFRERWRTIKSAAAAAGRSASEIDGSTQLMVAVARNAGEKRKAFLSAKVTLVLEKNILNTLGEGNLVTSPQYQNLLASAKSVKEAIRIAGRVPDAVVEKTAAIGGEEEVRQKVEEFQRAGVKQVTVAELIPPSRPRKMIEFMGRIIRRTG